VWVAVLNSTGYPQEVVDRAGAVSAPLLLLHGKANSPTDGGSERTAVDRARKFEDALRRDGKPVKQFTSTVATTASSPTRSNTTSRCGSSPPSSASTLPSDWDRRSGRTIRWTE
jgi:hypothetical protein